MKQSLTHAALTMAAFLFAAVGVQLFLPAQQITAQEQERAQSQQQQQQGEGENQNQEQQNQQEEQTGQQQEQQNQNQEQQPEAQREQEQQQQQDQNQQEEQQASDEQANDDAYQYVAQPGDSYTLMARKAIQTYGINNDVQLSLAEIIMAETHLVIEAGQPLLTVGQEVTISASAVEKWVENAQAMSPEQEADWQRYVPGVDFNTDSVGEAS